MLLVLVLAVAAVNRHDSILHAMAVTLVTMVVLGRALPWLALRSATLRAPGNWREEIEAEEGVPVALALQLTQQGAWPAWLVEVEAEWSWAGRSFVTRDAAAFLRSHTSAPVFESLRFDCRGRYRLVGLRLRSGFPLGLENASREVPVPPLSVLVRPASTLVRLPAEWTVSEESAGDHVLGDAGESLDLQMLRAYEAGDAVRRVDWRASARAGSLIVRQFHDPAAVVAKVIVQLPGPEEVGRTDAPREHVVRAAAGLCDFLAGQALRTVLVLPNRAAVRAHDAMSAALAEALPGAAGWSTRLHEASGSLRRGEQLVAVVAADTEEDALIQSERRARNRGARLLVLIATWPQAPGEHVRRGSELRKRLKAAGVKVSLAR